MLVDSRHSLGARSLLLLAAVLTVTLPASAERLSIKTFGTAEGLPHARIRQVTPDSRGFVWFCTPEGLARFDGERFLTYTAAQGLPAAVVNAILETRAGEHWVATEGGVCRLLPREQDGNYFECIPSGEGTALVEANSLFEEEDGTLWAGTEHGLFRLESAVEETHRFRSVNLGTDSPTDSGAAVRDLIRGEAGSLWIGTGRGVVHRLSSGEFTRYILHPGTGGGFVRALAFDETGRLWIGHESGLFVLLPDSRQETGTVTLHPEELHAAEGTPLPLPRLAGEVVGITSEGGLTHNVVRDIFRGSDGRMWVSQVGRGLLGYDGVALSRYTMENGLTDETLGAFAEDGLGRLWMGSDVGGAMRIDWTGFRSYGLPEGLGHTFVSSFFEDESDALWVVSGALELKRFDGRRFESSHPPRPAHSDDPYYFETGLRDHLGEWWVPTVDGLYRFPRADHLDELGSLRPRMLYGADQGLPGAMGTPFEDSRGDLWMARLGGGPAPLVRWERGTDRFHLYGEAEGLRAAIDGIAEAPDGRIWIGSRDGRIARQSGDGFEQLGKSGLLSGAIRELYWDSQGRLWIASARGGLGRLDDPDTVGQEMRVYGRSDGLGSLDVRCIVEDSLGMIWVGTARGIDRLDPETDRIRHYGSNDGLPNEEIFAAYRDIGSALWFGTLDGVSHLLPGADPPSVPPVARISAMRVGGRTVPLMELGQEAVETVRVPSDRRNVRLDFFAPSTLTGDLLRYEYRLLPGANWSEASRERTVHYAALEPGQYTFEVRAASAAAGAGVPATVSLVVFPPFWRTGWFVALVGLAVAGAVFSLHRYQLARAVGIERLRTRIATDLHDDIGSNLTQIAILSEVASQRQGGVEKEPVQSTLTRIASVSRETIDSMGDIVWAINPARDRADDLIHRMRRFASDLLMHGEIRFRLQAGSGAGKIRLDADTKRQIYLVFKESLRNALRHSSCALIDVSLEVDGSRLQLRLRDDGSGFDMDASSEGHGLESMKSRAQQLGGSLRVSSVPGEGTTVVLDVPLRRPRSPEPT